MATSEQKLSADGFKQVPGWPKYWCNQHGNIVSTHRKCWGAYYPLKEKTDKDGYLEIVLQNSGKRKYIKSHQVIAMTFMGECPTGYVVNHKDGNRQNNSIINLEYLTPADNERHARKELGKRCVGEKASRSKLKTEQVLKIVDLRNSGKTYQQIATEMGTSAAQVGRISRKDNWSHLDYEVKIQNRRDKWRAQCQNQRKSEPPTQTAR